MTTVAFRQIVSAFGSKKKKSGGEQVKDCEIQYTRLQAPRWRCWSLPSRKQSNMLPVRRRRSSSALPGRRAKPNRSRLWKHAEGFITEVQRKLAEQLKPHEDKHEVETQSRTEKVREAQELIRGLSPSGFAGGLEAEVGGLTLSDLYSVTKLSWTRGQSSPPDRKWPA